MSLLVYVLASAFLALFFFRGLKQYDGPPIPRSLLHHYALGPTPLPDREMFMFHVGMRRMLRGSLLRAAMLMVYWAAAGALFFGGELSMGGVAAILLSLPGGFALAIAWYNIKKRLL